MFCASQSGIGLTYNTLYHARTKHIDVSEVPAFSQIKTVYAAQEDSHEEE